MKKQAKAEVMALAITQPGGLLLPSVLLDWAKDHPDSALYKEFEWDDTEAARRYRIDQARTVIRLVIEFEPKVQRACRALVSVPEDRANGGGYRQTSQVLDNPGMVEQIGREAIGRINTMRMAYRHIAFLDPLWSRIEHAVAEFMQEVSNPKKTG